LIKFQRKNLRKLSKENLELGNLSNGIQNHLSGAPRGPLGIEGRYDLIDFGSEARADVGIVQQAQRLRGEGFRRRKMLDELAYEVRRRSCRKTGVRGWILLVVIEDVNDAQAINIDEPAAYLKG
jgi:hypothetical protein